MKDEDQWDRMNHLIRAKQFRLGAVLPISWKSQSRVLRHAASRLYTVYYDACRRDSVRFLAKVEAGEINEGIRTLEGQELQDSKDASLIGIYFFLMGYAVENLLKGILMIQHPEFFKSSGKMTAIRSHKLVELCQRCGISLLAEEIALLDELTTYIEWMGKYPIPLDGEDKWPIKQDDGTWKTKGHSFDGMKTYERVEQLYAKILNEFERIQTASSTDS